ncbi:MAG: NFACT RNA binding domain-containing protein [Candidatus Micrarchaeia archaeon]
MEVIIDYTKSAQENANDYYNLSKKFLQKKAGAESTIKELEDKISKAKISNAKEPSKKPKIEESKEWYEKFHWLITSNGMLAIGGRDAHQNEQLNSKYFNDKDLFFHADIFGASVFILINGLEAPKEIKEEAAGFAACYSNAWDLNVTTVDVYAMRRDQVSKSTMKGSLGTGSFLLSGEREWYKNMPLSLVVLIRDKKLVAIPKSTFGRIGETGPYVVVEPGRMKKTEVAKQVASILKCDIDKLMQILPSGSMQIAKL